jgi:biopolymer transport protein ExbD
MAASQLLESPSVEASDDGAIVLRSRIASDAQLDMTPMIDCVFLLLIYFLVASRPDVATAVTLPSALFGSAVSAKQATIITVADPGGEAPVLVYLADGKKGSPLGGTAEQQAAAIRDAVQDGLRAGKANVLIKAERKTRHREVARVARAATQVEGVTLYLAVADKLDRERTASR